ncbi:MAG: hypothetical protein DRH76_00115 [Deltaproteobacteria bacterium]|nr:MAG: hypothetical protein DRH76_00115 [Deltaproteobacteria bacterium]
MVNRMAERGLERVPFTRPANLCGIQFIGPFGTGDRFFRLAVQLEAARPWFARRPPALNHDLRSGLRAQK